MSKEPYIMENFVDDKGRLGTARAVGTPDYPIAGDPYTGVNLAKKFAAEIANHSDEWAWIKARIQAGNFSGIHVCDYIPFTANYNVFHACVAGINNYKDYASTGSEVGNHIDFMCEELWPTSHKMNPAGWNNGLIPVENVSSDGTSVEYTLTKEMNEVASITIGGVELTGWNYSPENYKIKFEEAPAAGTMVVTGTGTEYPWLAAEGYLWLNSLAGHVANSTDAPPNTAIKRVDFTQDGVYFYLPQELKDVIVEKKFYLEKRYNSSSKLNASNAAGWTDIGKLWLPTEVEVMGCTVWGGSGYAASGSNGKYPIFNTKNRIKKVSGGDRADWWLLTITGTTSSNWCRIGLTGNFFYQGTNVAQYFPVCFRIA